MPKEPTHENDAITAKVVSRREALHWALGGAMVTLSGCSMPNIMKPRPTCLEVQSTDGLIIDMHCHLMNRKDVNLKTFVDRRVINSDESIWKVLVTYFPTWLIEPLAEGWAMTSTEELEWISQYLTELQTGAQHFCDLAIGAQKGWVFASKDPQWMFASKNIQGQGMLRNRTRNAARMIELFPSVDLFTPSMVDLYEGPTKNTSKLIELVRYYKQLHIASQGRFIPLVSFSPERAYWERNNPENSDYKRPFSLVQYCIEELGFIGVKVHPSSGFAPVNNMRHACPNTFMQIEPDKRRWKDEREFYDKEMERLFQYCSSVDVPILTHNSTGIDANEKCMHRFDNQLEWTNSPVQWGAAIRNWKIRVCLAHFADGFDKEAEPKAWLAYVLAHLESLPGMYLDISHPDDMLNPDGNSIRPEMRTAFVDLLRRHPVVGKRLMYGSDWHMPEVAELGERYYAIMNDLIPSENKRRVMGMTAVEFFGLERGRQTRERLEKFYKSNSVPLEKVPWLRKLTRIEQDLTQGVSR